MTETKRGRKLKYGEEAVQRNYRIPIRLDKQLREQRIDNEHIVAMLHDKVNGIDSSDLTELETITQVFHGMFVAIIHAGVPDSIREIMLQEYNKLSPTQEDFKKKIKVRGYKIPLIIDPLKFPVYRKYGDAMIFAVGDAALLPDPSSGKGIEPAWLSGQLVAEHLDDPIGYEEAIRKHCREGIHASLPKRIFNGCIKSPWWGRLLQYHTPMRIWQFAMGRKIKGYEERPLWKKRK